MNLKIYEKTRYQNIYRHKKNKNYIIDISKPIKTSISKIDGLKIYDIDIAKDIRDSYSNTSKINSRGTFQIIYDKYLYDCEYILKRKKRTISKKKKIFKKYLKDLCPNKLLLKITKDDIVEFLNSKTFKDATDKQKNNALKELKAFFNWCKPKYIKENPSSDIKFIKVEKKLIKFWTVDDFIKFINVVERDMKSNNLTLKYKAFLVHTLAIIGMAIGDRLGETRTLSYNSFDRDMGIVKIEGSIDEDYEISTTKTYNSTRCALAPNELFDCIDNYREFLSNEMEYIVKDDTLLFLNFKRNKPYSDTNLRKHFYYYIDLAKVPKITMYELRHSYVANMLEQGLELYHISENIGHSSYNTTMKYYGGMSESLKKKIGNASSNIFKK